MCFTMFNFFTEGREVGVKCSNFGVKGREVNVQIYVKHNPFGTNRIISQSDPYYNMLFEDYSDSCDAMYYTKEKKK